MYQKCTGTMFSRIDTAGFAKNVPIHGTRGNCPPFEDYDIDATESRRRRDSESRRRRDSVTSRGVVERVKEETMTRLGTKRRNRHGGKYQA